MKNVFHIDAAAVESSLSVTAAIEALRRFHRDSARPITHRQVLRDYPGSANTFAALSAWQPGEFIAVKLIAEIPSNLALSPPMPSGQGLLVLLDGATGRPLMTCDATALTRIKTAADSALGVDLLARQNCVTLLVVGAGGLARTFVEAIKSVRPSITRVILWNRSVDRAEALAEQLAISGVEASLARTLEEGLGDADVVTSLTAARTPLILGRHVRSGTHVDLVGSYQPDMREADDELLLKAGRVFVDSKSDCRISGDISQPLASGALLDDQIFADLFDLCSGFRSARRDSEEITIFKNVGGAHLDLAIASELYRRATL